LVRSCSPAQGVTPPPINEAGASSFIMRSEYLDSVEAPDRERAEAVAIKQ
jgi:hypothetical protein